jgi:hypothetical protein
MDWPPPPWIQASQLRGVSQLVSHASLAIGANAMAAARWRIVRGARLCWITELMPAKVKVTVVLIWLWVLLLTVVALSASLRLGVLGDVRVGPPACAGQPGWRRR